MGFLVFLVFFCISYELALSKFNTSVCLFLCIGLALSVTAVCGFLLPLCA